MIIISYPHASFVVHPDNIIVWLFIVSFNFVRAAAVVAAVADLVGRGIPLQLIAGGGVAFVGWDVVSSEGSVGSGAGELSHRLWNTTPRPRQTCATSLVCVVLVKVFVVDGHVSYQTVGVAER